MKSTIEITPQEAGALLTIMSQMQFGLDGLEIANILSSVRQKLETVVSDSTKNGVGDLKAVG